MSCKGDSYEVLAINREEYDNVLSTLRRESFDIGAGMEGGSYYPYIRIYTDELVVHGNDRQKNPSPTVTLNEFLKIWHHIVINK